MARLFSNRERPYDMGVLPTELLARDAAAEIVDSRQPGDLVRPHEASIAPALQEHFDFCVKYLEGEVAPAKAPVPDDLLSRARNLKASAYFLDATLAGVCELQPGEHPAHTHAFVFLVEFGREP
ncbi:MAG TPA: Fe-S protein, partial [Burkholderiales bacterium]|nr:Fe-S protein [Burkholderiales bacterium]